jgi:hypothetical protein
LVGMGGLVNRTVYRLFDKNMEVAAGWTPRGWTLSARGRRAAARRAAGGPPGGNGTTASAWWPAAAPGTDRETAPQARMDALDPRGRRAAAHRAAAWSFENAGAALVETPQVW